MKNEDFFDFMLFNELMFPEDSEETFKCPFCGRAIERGEKVQTNKEKCVFKCPDCGSKIEF